MADTLLDQVLKELDYATGELQRTSLTLSILCQDDKDHPMYKRIQDCLRHRIDSAKAVMILAGYTPIAYQNKR